MLTCIGCNGQAHIACVIRHYNKEKPKSTCKCAAEWMFNFFKLSHFRYIYHACHEKAGGKSFSPSSSILHNSAKSLKQDIACNEMINKTLEQLSADVKQMHIQIIKITAKMNNSVPTAHIVTFDDLLSQQGTASVSTSQPQDAHVNPDGHKTYAAACSAEIKQMVKSAFVESIKEQLSSERDSTSIVIYGMSESINDEKNVHDLFKDTTCKGSIVRVYRIGKRLGDANGYHKLVPITSDQSGWS